MTLRADIAADIAAITADDSEIAVACTIGGNAATGLASATHGPGAVGTLELRAQDRVLIVSDAAAAATGAARGVEVVIDAVTYEITAIETDEIGSWRLYLREPAP